MKTKKKLLLITLFVILLTLALSPQFLSLLGFPSNLRLIQGIEQSLKIYFPFNVYVQCDQPGQLLINGIPMSDEVLKISLTEPISLQSNALGSVAVDFKLFGLIPIKQIKLDVVRETKVMPGGHSIGVLLHSDGIIVVENSWVISADGKKYYPAREAGIEQGDYILEINGKKVLSKQDVARVINQSGKQGKDLQIKVRKENGKIVNLKVHPVKNKDGDYMIGLYIDDGVAGVGTMSFYEPETGKYAALGHVITDAYTDKPLQIRAGEIVNARISGINTGKRGLPGEKLGTFIDIHDDLGVIEKNCEYGIYGVLNKFPENPFFKEPIPVATSRQVKKGRAWIYTVVEGGEIEKFAIEIEHVSHQNRPASKGLIIRVVDPALLRVTGGIIQGMSGSPIVQNGLLVGAVTHVFVNNPKKGYGVLAEWMVEEAGIKDLNKQRKLAQ